MESVRTASVLQNKSYAAIVADNQIIELKILPLQMGIITGDSIVMWKKLRLERRRLQKHQAKIFMKLR